MSLNTPDTAVKGKAVREDYTVETQGLTKRYGKITAVEGLDLTINRGEVYGFLGPNGAGKTTTLRMLLGLIKPTSGNAEVLGEDLGTPPGLCGVGALVESPAFYPHLSGRDNLKIMALYSDGVKKDRMEEVLKLVGLDERAKDKYKKYSLGMKQRLGVAAALLDDPQLLVLDEPTNGLDPKGMAEMRQLIRKLGEGERTVLLSSHLMNEVEQVCDRVGIIHKGELVKEGAIEELRAGEGLLLKAEPLEEASRIIGGISEVESLEVKDDTIRVTADPALAPKISEELNSSGVRVKEIREFRQSLEEVFLELTGEKGGE